jgi:hypothetical protein
MQTNWVHANGELEPHRRGTVALGAAALLVPAWLFAVAADAPHALLLTALGGAWALTLRRPWPVTTRTVVYSAVAAAVLAVLGDQVMPVQQERFFLVPGHLLGPLLLYAGTILLFLPQGRAPQAGVLAAGCLVMLLAGNRMLAVPPLERLALLQPWLPRFFFLYAGASVLQVCVMLGLLARAEPHREPEARPASGSRGQRRLLRGAILAVALLLLGGGVLGLRWSALAYERFVARAFGALFDQYLTRQWWRFFEADVDLWQTLPPDPARERAVVLRARAPAAPGYLRGRAYRSYGGGRWKASEPIRTLTALDAQRGRLAFTHFRRLDAAVRETGASAAPTPAAAPAIELFPTGRISSRCLLVPGGAEEVRASARDLREDRDGSLIADGWEWRAGYGVAGDPPAVYDRPRPPGEEYLDLPSALAERLRALASAIPPVGERQPPAAHHRVHQVCAFLEERCRYELGVRISGRGDPVLQFLDERRRGHCELFATAAVLLLRAQGIPARYVTGFVCVEPHPGRGYWLARLRHAHAWAEAWLPDEQRWVLVDATPGSDERFAFAEVSSWAADWDWLAFQWQRFIGWLKNGYAAAHVLAALGWAWHGLVWLVGEPVRATAVVMILLAVTLRRAVARRQRRATRLDSDARADLCREWARLERRWARAAGRRPPGMTVREFARRVAAHDAAGAARCLWLAERYEALRYRVRPPVPDEVQAFAREAAEPLPPVGS